MEYDESLETCGVRELQEETGLVVKQSDLALAAIFQSNFEPGIHYLNYIYKTKKFTGILTNGEPEKINKLNWYFLDKFPDKLTIGLRVFMKSLEDMKILNYHITPRKYEELMGESYLAP